MDELGALGFCTQMTTAPIASRTTRASELRNSVFHCSVGGIVVDVFALKLCGWFPKEEDCSRSSFMEDEEGGGGVNGISSTHIGTSAV